MEIARYSHVVLSGSFIVCLSWLPGCRTAPANTSPLEHRTEGASRSDHEASARGFPALRTLEGKTLADGEFAQRLENGRLHISIRYDFVDGRRVEEKAVLRQEPELAQEEWSWREVSREGKVLRQFHVDFASGRATAEKQEGNDLKRWSKDLEIKPGRTFAGFGMSLAVKRIRERLIRGEKIELRGVGFTPKPAVGSVEVSYGGLDRMSMSGRTLRGERFVLRVKVPWVARIFVHVPETQIWFIHPPPASFLRWEGPLAEPGDPVVRVDLFPGEPSGPAEPDVTSP